ncbi:MAG: M42 family metallopeptidase [Solirubrobacteraceae bacterium]|nr:M42 family metallopeptidase [Solirubrobacteraceae bacterium]
MSIPSVLRSLLTAPGPSGYEATAAAVWREAASAFGAQVAGDVMGSSTARVAGTAGGPTLAIVGHIDEIGLIITSIEDSGMLRFTGVGGWDPQVLIGQRVELQSKGGAVQGVIGRKPIHLLEADDRKKVQELKALHIDVGAKDGEQAASMVRVGDVAVIAGEPLELPNGRAASRAMDNRLGCFVALEAGRLVAERGGAPGDVVAIAAVQEETTFGGSRTSAHALEPDLAIAVDVTHATDAPGLDESEHGRHRFGSGPVIERGSNLHPAVSELLIEVAEAEGIPYTLAASARHTGTDADAIHISRGGVPTGLVSLPLRYMHSPVEMVDLGDVEATARLLAAFAMRLPADAGFER